MTPKERLNQIVRGALAAGGGIEHVERALVDSLDVEAALALFDSVTVAARLRALVKILSGSHPSVTQKGHNGRTPAPNGRGRGQAPLTEGHTNRTPAASDPTASSATAPGQSFTTGDGHPDGTGAAAEVHVREHKRHMPGHAKPLPPSVLAANALVKAGSPLLVEVIGVGKRPIGQIAWREVHHLFKLRRNDAMATSREAYLLAALRPFVPKEKARLNQQIMDDDRVPEIAAALADAARRWSELEEAMQRRPLGGLERLLIEGGVPVGT